jgi:hypothetical protein
VGESGRNEEKDILAIKSKLSSKFIAQSKAGRISRSNLVVFVVRKGKDHHLLPPIWKRGKALNARNFEKK